KFMTLGLVISAIVMIVAGVIPYPKNGAITTAILFVLTCLTGWFSGMGWPPCGRVMSHWFSTNERSFKMSVWNTAHNIGSSGLAWLATIGGGAILMAFGVSETEAGWREAFIIPSIAALAVAGLCWWFIRDTPESCGLPPIDKYRNDFSGAKAKKGEENKIPFKTLFVDYVLKNKMLWLIGFANILVYLVRNGISDWLPIYLQEVHDIAKSVSKNLYAYHMLAAIPGTLIAGWLSSKFFQGRCAPVNVICMAITAIGAFVYWQAAPIAEALGVEYISVVIAALVITGFAVYGPVAMISIQAIAVVPKNAAGTAAGFMGLLGYLIGDAFLSKIAFGRIVESGDNGWNLTFIGFFVASVVAAAICLLAMGKEKKMFEDRVAAAKAEQK
ncbi:MAG: MFS transporter, partial [Alistipes sp.]|nr:MFS transporter [Alistipes sp.]